MRKPETIENKLYRWARYRAKKNNVQFTLERKDIIVPKYCPILGIPLESGEGHAWYRSPTVDRFDNEKGYTSSNVWVISSLANQMKSSANPKQMVNFAKWIINNFC